MADQVQLNNIGTAFRFTLTDDNGIVDISGATTLEIIMEKPDASTVTFTAVFVTDGTDGLMQYVTLSGNIDQIGVWKVQGRVVMPGADFRTKVSTFNVYSNL